MLKRRIFLLGLGALVFGCLGRGARAHEGHLVIPKEQAIAMGRELVALLVKRGKLASSWSGAAVESSELSTVDDLEQWRVVFRNDAEAVPAQQTLHVFLNYDGQFLGANFTGTRG